MADLLIPHNGVVVVGDGRKVLLMRNEGNDKQPRLVVAQSLEAPSNPSTATQGADAPGRAFNSGDGRRSAVEQTDWHLRAEDAFAREAATIIDKVGLEEHVRWMALVAPAHVLSEWRKHLANATRDKVKSEVVKDLTRHPIRVIEALLTQSAERDGK